MATTTFNDLITFSRGSNATVTGPNGLIQWAPSNLLTNSQDFESAAWSKSGTATIVANSALSPDGTITGDKLVFNLGAAPGAAYVYRAVSGLTSGIRYTQSVFIKEAGVTTANIWSNISGSYTSVRINLSTGVLSQNGAQPLPASYSAISAGSGWWRVTISETASGTSGNVVYVDTSVTGDGTNGVSIWGAQLELGSTATTYNNTSVRNLLGFSEAFDNAAWTKSASSIVTGAQANPVNGLFNAQKLMENTATNVHRVQQGFATTTGVTYTFSCYAKAAERSWIYLYDDAANGFAFFDLANGVKGTIAAGWTSTSITPVGNGWYRISGTATEASGGAGNQLIGIASANNVSNYTGDGNSGVYIYGAMLSNSASLDPYVPTPGAAPSSTAYYGPRFDYDPVTLLPRGLLIEEARTNLALRSEEFDNAAWAKGNSTVTANAATSPDGTVDADKLVENTATSTHTLSINTAAASSVYTYSVYAKAAERTFIRLRDSVNNVNGYFDLVNGTTSGALGGTLSMVAVGNGWYRCIMVSSAAVTNPEFGIRLASNASTDNYTGDGVSGAFVWGAQLEAGAFATSYIPTVASTVTRSADVATITGSLFSQWYRQDEGTFIAEAAQLAATGVNSRSLSANDGTVNESVQVSFLSTGNGGYGEVRDGGTAVVSITNGSFAVGSVAKMAFAVAVNNAALSVNAASPTADTSLTMPTVDRLSIGTHAGAASPLNGHIRSIRYVPVRAADFQLQQVTT